MKVKDLRIGNIVYGGWEDYEENSHFSICLVTGLSEDQYLGEGWNFMLENMETKGVENYFEMKPIPLTEEWLLKFGFNKDYQKGYIGIDVGNSDFVLTEPLHMGEWQTSYAFQFIAGNVPKFKQIEFVDQLQNLFFALCGEELELKETL